MTKNDAVERALKHFETMISSASGADEWLSMNDIEVIRQALQTSRPDAGWKSIESAPRDGTEILVFARNRPEGKNCTVAFWKDREENTGWAFVDNEHMTLFLGDDITHWQALPSPPASTVKTNKGE